MFNSIRKDDSCRKLVKSFEILRLQNKIIVEAMSKSDVFSMQVEKKVSDVAFIDNAEIKSNADKKPSLLSSNSTLQNEKLSTIVTPKIRSSVAKAKTSGEAKSEFFTEGEEFSLATATKKTIPFAIAFAEGGRFVQNKVLQEDDAKNKGKTNKAFYNHNCFTDLELCKSNLHLFAKKGLKAKNENKITNLSIKDNNKSSSSKINVSYKAFSSSLLSLAKGRIISLPRNSSKSRIKNRCIETGRSHSVLRFCKLSRICLRDNASKALISGISKASW